jgi:membrane protein required for colicin V production
MSLQILDFVLAGFMLLSGLLALARGFTREVLSLVTWILAAGAAYLALQQPALMEFAGKQISNKTIATVSVAGVAFLITLIILSILSVRLSDWVVDSAAGSFDRTLGFLYGLARGLVFVAICYLAYSWISPSDKQQDWIKNAQSLPIIESVGNFIVSYIPPDVRKNFDRSHITTNPEAPVTAPAPDGTQQQGYNDGQTQGLNNLVNGASQAQAQQQ